MRAFSESHWPKELAVKIVKGDGRAKLAVFEDPNCGYCQMFDQQTLTQMDNITIYIFLWPFLGEDSVVKAGSILNAPDPAQALIDWMDNGVPPDGEPSPRTDEIIEKVFQLAQELGLQGTPAVFTADGHGPYGAMTPSQLRHKMIEEP